MVHTKGHEEKGHEDLPRKTAVQEGIFEAHEIRCRAKRLTLPVRTVATVEATDALTSVTRIRLTNIPIFVRTRPAKFHGALSP